jgi:hypothetical protein
LLLIFFPLQKSESWGVHQGHHRYLCPQVVSQKRDLVSNMIETPVVANAGSTHSALEG